MLSVSMYTILFFFFQAEDGIRDLVRSRGLGDVYKRQQLTIASDLHNLPLIAQFVRNAGRAAGLNDDALFAIELACDEACNNVIEHAYRDAAGPLPVSYTHLTLPTSDLV